MKKVLFVSQRKTNECGVAALKMISDYYLSSSTSYDEILWLCNVMSKGISIYSLCNVASLLGLKALPIRVSFEVFLGGFPQPVIAYVNGSHFVVLHLEKKDYVCVLDPAKGEEHYSYEKFHEYWIKHITNNIVITMELYKPIESLRNRPCNYYRGRQAIVLVYHNENSIVMDNYYQLRKQLNQNRYEIFLLFNTKDNQPHDYSEKYRMIFFEKDINSIGYIPISKAIIPGSTHFPLLTFYQHHNQFAAYWFIEYDVLFTGDWPILIDDCYMNLPDYDFLSCHIEKYNSETNKMWPWWYIRNRVGITYRQCVKGFNPISRYSNRALTCLDQYMKQGYSAHSEVMITTCLYHHGMKIGDIGGQGEFVPKGWENRYYLAGEGVNNGTMRYRPVYTREEIEKTGLKNKLFHPLKE